jgi:Tol biopolymer transport system component
MVRLIPRGRGALGSAGEAHLHRRTASRISHRMACLFGIAVALQPSLWARPLPQACTTFRASVNSNGEQSNSGSAVPFLSASGRYVAFSSSAANLVGGDTNAVEDAFLHDRDPDGNGLFDEGNGVTERTSLSYWGAQSNGYSSSGPVSADGRLAVFASRGDNLVGHDLNNVEDIFIRDRLLGTTTRVSVDSGGNEGNGSSGTADISGDGRFVCFESSASNLVGGDTNGVFDIFVHDLWTSQTSRVSVDSLGQEGLGHSWDPSLSSDGRFVCYLSDANNLVPGDSNGLRDVFVHDRSNGQTIRISVTSAGTQCTGFAYSASIAGGGRFVVFADDAPDLVLGDTNGRLDIFLHDLAGGQTSLVSVRYQGTGPGDSDSDWPDVSADGRFVSFQSFASNLVPNHTFGWDIYVRDCQLNTTTICSVSSSGVEGNGQSVRGRISEDGRHVAFHSIANNLVPGDTNLSEDIFVRYCSLSAPLTYCIAKPNSLGCTPQIGFAGSPSASAGSGFQITAQDVLSYKSGLLFYSRVSSAMLPFQGGYLCVSPPLKRTPVQSSGGVNPPPALDCTGNYGFDFNAWIAGGQDPALVSGEEVWGQYWSRDPGYPAPQNTGLTNALAFAIGP